MATNARLGNIDLGTLSVVSTAKIRETFEVLSADERWVLARFIRKVNDLKTSTFAQQPIGLAGALMAGESHLGGQAWEISLNLPSEESLKAVIGDFGQLYTDSNPTSAARVLSILKRRALERDSPAGREAIHALKKIREHLRSRGEDDPVASILDFDPTGTFRERSP